MLEIPKPESNVKKYSTYLLSISLFFVITLLSITLLQKGQGNQQYHSALAKVEEGSVQRKILGQGKLKARDSNIIISEVEGIITHIIQHPGTVVQKNQNLITLKNPELLRTKEKLNLKLLEAKAEHSSTIADLEAKLIALENEVKVAESDIGYAKQEVKTLTSLLDSGGVAKLDHIRATNRFKKSQLTLSLAKKNLSIFKKTRHTLEQASQYKLLAAEKELALAEFDITQLDIVAGTEGILGSYSEQVEIGKMLTRGEVLGQISNKNSLFLDFFVSANDAAEISKNMKVFIDIRGNIIKGSVLRIHPNVENNLVQVEATILDKLPNIARENIDVLVEVIVEEVERTLRVKTPNNIDLKSNQQIAYVIKNEKFLKREITVGVIGKDYMQVLDGLKNGEQILLNPNESKDI